MNNTDPLFSGTTTDDQNLNQTVAGILNSSNISTVRGSGPMRPPMNQNRPGMFHRRQMSTVPPEDRNNNVSSASMNFFSASNNTISNYNNDVTMSSVPITSSKTNVPEICFEKFPEFKEKQLVSSDVQNLAQRIGKIILQSRKEDEKAKKTKATKHNQEMSALDKEIEKLEKELSKEENAVKSLEVQHENLKVKFKKQHDALVDETLKLKEEKKEKSQKVRDMKDNVEQIYNELSLPTTILRMFRIDPLTGCCPEGKRVAPIGDEPAECNIFDCPAIRSEFPANPSD